MKSVLDHGYVKLVESWGSDERIIEAARQSTGKGFKGWGILKCLYCDVTSLTGRLPDTRCPTGRGGAHVVNEKFQAGDEKLLRFLWENKHHTPFEMGGVTIEVQAPIFVLREWHRHRTQSYNEMSARYTQIPTQDYIPTVGRLLMDGGMNKQAQALPGKVLESVHAQEWLDELQRIYFRIEEHYQLGLQLGVPKELARLPLPVARYSRMRASANLRNWLWFLGLRNDPRAQFEIRQYAIEVDNLIKGLFPRTHAIVHSS
jgi:thymidylate synthase (FAD)